MPKGGKREGAGRPSGTGRYAESARSIRVPHSLLGPVSEMLAEHLRSVATERRVSEKQLKKLRDDLVKTVRATAAHYEAKVELALGQSTNSETPSRCRHPVSTFGPTIASSLEKRAMPTPCSSTKSGCASQSTS